MDELLDAPISILAGAIRQKKIKSADVVRGFLDRIERINPALNAVVLSTAELALKYAEKYDAELANGQLRGPLHGVPMTIKDSLDTSDAVTTWGTLGRKEYRPGRDATVVARLKDAGAIMLGKTNTPEFTLWFQTDNLVYGRTNNPYNPLLTPGGSSGGAAAIIAAGASPFDIGTDTGGSIRLPSHFCGITGIKPTTGLVPCTGNALPSSGMIAPLSQPGPMARYVEDLVILLNIIKGPDLIDPHVLASPTIDPDSIDVNSLRFAFHTDNGIKKPDGDIVNAIQAVVDRLQAQGQAVTEARPSGVEMSSFIISRVFGADGGEMVEALLEDARTTTPSPRIAASLSRQDNGISNREFARVIELWDSYRSSMLGFFNDFDVLLCPVNAHTAIPHGQEEDMAAYSYTMAYNLSGWPGAVIRCGTSSTGMPIGLQIVARPFREDICLAVAGHLEQAMGPFAPPGISALNQNP